MDPLHSAVPGIQWPAIAEGRGAQLLALLWQFAQSECWSADRLLKHQMQQLTQAAMHAARTVPFYRERLAALRDNGDRSLTLEEWRQLPLLTRRDIQDAGTGLRSNAIPPQFGGVRESHTSGATGQPVVVLRTAVDDLIWQANALRDHLWHQRDQSLTLAAIRYIAPGVVIPADGKVVAGWGPASDAVRVTGNSALLSITSDIEAQAGWLIKVAPGYLLTYPSNLAALLRYFSARGERLPGLRAVLTVSEGVPVALRDECRETLGVNIEDVYSSQELGYIALQCPVSGQYHVMAENTLVEVLDAAGNQCAAGETGRLVISSLHNFATPLIRYELRDYATVGEPCACGRTLPTLVRIVGRERNMVRLPDGTTHWPVLGFHRFRAVAPVRQFQMVQHSLNAVEVRLVCDRVLTAAEEERLDEIICAALGYPFELDFTYYERDLPRAQNGKFEEFVCAVA